MNPDESHPEPEVTPASAEESSAGESAGEAAELRAALAEQERRWQASETARKATVERLRLVLVASEPALRPEMVTGGTAEEVEASFAAARELVAEVREAVRRTSIAAIPAGAPGRASLTPPSAIEKIRAGLARIAS